MIKNFMVSIAKKLPLITKDGLKEYVLELIINADLVWTS
jgi:hypothetical protein